MKFDQMEKKFNENEDESGNNAMFISSQAGVSVSLVSLAKRDPKIDDLTMITCGFASANDLLAA